MEFVQGRSVADILEKDGPMPPARVENILRQVCGSLEEAHGHGIVHRDLKPDNVVLCERAGQKDWVEVLDFGIAKRSSEHDPNEAKLTQQGMVLGTPPYMSPEQFTGQPVDVRSDIYALGVMTYEMLIGKLPVRGQHRVGVGVEAHDRGADVRSRRSRSASTCPRRCATRSSARSRRTRTSASAR